MSRFGSIRAKSVVYTLLIVLVPLIVLGALGTLYYHSIFQQNIQNDYQEEARTIAALTSSYLDRSAFYLDSQSERSALVGALDRRDAAGLDDQLEKIAAASDSYYWAFVTDTSGRVIASYPFGDAIGADMSGRPYISAPLANGSTYIGSPAMSAVTGRITTIVGTPVEENGTVIGVLAGALDEDRYVAILSQASAFEPMQDIFLVNRTGQVIYSQDRKYMGLDFSSLHAANCALTGEEGVDRGVNVTGIGTCIAAYAPVPKYGLGAIVAIPEEDAYRPVNNALSLLLPGLAILAAFAVVLALAAGNYIARPVSDVAAAIDRIAAGGDISGEGLRKYLPYDRDDELGGLARNFREMADRITAARDKIAGEKQRADMYIDVMGHDINNLNQVILGNLELAQHYDHLDDRQKEFLDRAIMATRESADIVKNVKAIQSITTERPELRPVDLDQVIQGCLREVPRPADKQVSVSYEPRKGAIVRALPELKLAFCSAIGNSIRYSGSEVRIAITISETEAGGHRQYVTTIEDDGNGIPDDARRTLFTRFQREASARPGKGLGLYTAKALAEAFGGTLEIGDRVPGDYRKGTKVTITLPAAEVD